MKKGFCVLLSSLTLQLALAQVDLTVSDVNAAAGSKVIVAVMIDEGQDLTAIQFALEFDANILSIADDSSILAGDSLTDHSVGSNIEAGRLTVVIFSSSLDSMASGAGTLVRVFFEVHASAAPGSSTSIQLSEIQSSDTDGLSVPVTARSGTVTISSEGNVPAEGENQLIFSQIANGTLGGDAGSFFVTLIFVNRTDVDSDGQVKLFKSDGTPFAVTLTDGRSGSSFDFTVPAGGSLFLKTDGSGALEAGYAVLNATGPLGGTLLFTWLTPTGETVTEAGVGASPIGLRFSIPVLFEQGVSNTGVAFANITSETVELTLIRKSEAGVELGRQPQDLGPGEHLPRFVDQFFDMTGEAEFQGSLEIIASGPVSALALKQKGELLTTFPVIVPTS